MYGMKNRIALVGFTSLALASLIVAASSADPQTTLYIHGFGAQVEPKQVVVSPGSACAPAADHLNSWRRWGAARTSSRGRLYFSRGHPDCASPTHRTGGKVVLSHARDCPSGVHYLRVRFVFSNHHSRDRIIDVKCDGYLTPS